MKPEMMQFGWLQELVHLSGAVGSIDIKDAADCSAVIHTAPRVVSLIYAAEKSLKKRCWSLAYASMMGRHSESSAMTCKEIHIC
jgi:hypothetical protein